LAVLPDEECRQIAERNRPLLKSHPNYGPEALLRHIALSREQGYALNRGQMRPEMAAVGMALRNIDGQYSAALSVAAITSRMDDERLRFIVNLLKDEVKVIERALRH